MRYARRSLRQAKDLILLIWAAAMAEKGDYGLAVVSGMCELPDKVPVQEANILEDAPPEEGERPPSTAVPRRCWRN